MGRALIVSQAGETVPWPYFKMIGVIFFSDKKAPFLKGKTMSPFEVVPSGKIRNGGMSPSSSASSYRSLICYRILSFSSLVPPRQIQRLLSEFAIIEMTGLPCMESFGARAGSIFNAKTGVSNQLTWLPTIVDECFLLIFSLYFGPR